MLPLVQILNLLSPKDLCCVAATCRYFYRAIFDGPFAECFWCATPRPMQAAMQLSAEAPQRAVTWSIAHQAACTHCQPVCGRLGLSLFPCGFHVQETTLHDAFGGRGGGFACCSNPFRLQAWGHLLEESVAGWKRAWECPLVAAWCQSIEGQRGQGG